MSKQTNKQKTKKHQKYRKYLKKDMFKFQNINLGIFAAAILVIIIGYMIMGSAEKANEFNAVTLGPIILFIGYVILVPIGILYGKIKTDNDESENQQT